MSKPFSGTNWSDLYIRYDLLLAESIGWISYDGLSKRPLNSHDIAAVLFSCIGKKSGIANLRGNLKWVPILTLFVSARLTTQRLITNYNTIGYWKRTWIIAANREEKANFTHTSSILFIVYLFADISLADTTSAPATVSESNPCYYFMQQRLVYLEMTFWAAFWNHKCFWNYTSEHYVAAMSPYAAEIIDHTSQRNTCAPGLWK